MATHSSVLAWRIPGMEEPGGLLSVGSHRVEQDGHDLAAADMSYLILPEVMLPASPSFIPLYLSPSLFMPHFSPQFF